MPRSEVDGESDRADDSRLTPGGGSGAARRGRRWVVPAALAAVAVIGWIDHETGPEIGLALFYLLPITAAGWWSGRAGGLSIAILAAASWLAADLLTRTGTGPGPILWNGFSRLVIFAGAALLLDALRTDREALRRLNAQLRRVAEAEGRLARTDPLTGLRNRRAFIEDLGAEVARCDRAGEPLCVAYLDVDGFKRLNDTHGHLAGDELLQGIAATLLSAAREADVPARLAGDEFAVLLRSVSAEAARPLADRLLERLREVCRPHEGLGLGASMGIAHFSRLPVDVGEVLSRADAAMYEAKRSTRGGLVLWRDTEGPEPHPDPGE